MCKLIFVLFLAIGLSACGSTDDTSHVQASQVVPDVKSPTVVAWLGDSITFRWDLDTYATRTTNLDLGVSGETCAQITQRVATATDSAAETVVLLAGTNDMLKTTDDPIQCVTALASTLHAAGMRVILCTLPWNSASLGDGVARITSFNAELAGWASNNGYEWVDYYSVTAGRAGLFVDGIHPNAAGYAVLWAQLSPVLYNVVFNPEAQ